MLRIVLNYIFLLFSSQLILFLNDILLRARAYTHTQRIILHQNVFSVIKNQQFYKTIFLTSRFFHLDETIVRDLFVQNYTFVYTYLLFITQIKLQFTL